MEIENINPSAVLKNCAWTTFPKWAQMLEVADAVTESIDDTERQVEFSGRAAREMLETDPSALEGLDFSWYARYAWAQRPTPCGCTEIWGSVLQEIDQAEDRRKKEAA